MVRLYGSISSREDVDYLTGKTLNAQCSIAGLNP
mgnify:CR=1 FL=1